MANTSRSFWIWASIAAFVVLLLVYVNVSGKPAFAKSAIVDPSSLPGLTTGDTPWPTEIRNLRARLKAIGVPPLASEGSALHIHQHLDIFVDGQPVAVPAEIGVDEPAFIAPIHTHDDSGIIHVESPVVQTFTLGQFFDIWGVRFTNSCIGGYCSSATSTLKVYVDGTAYQGDPRQLPLKEHEEIAVVYGQPPAPIPPTFAFPPGY